MDKKRIVLGLLIAAVLVGLLLVVPVSNPLTLIGLLAVCGLAMNEIYELMARGNLPASKCVGIVSGLTLVAATWCDRTSSTGLDEDGHWAILLAILMVNFFRLLSQQDALEAVRNALGTFFGLIYVALFWSFFVRLYMAGDPSQPTRVAFFLLLTVKWGDAGAYFIGSKFGKRRLAPSISPKKSWEGLIGGILFSTGVSVAWWALSDGMLGPYALSGLHALALGILLPVIGTLGDLVESLFKRAVDVKDSGAIAHGMGGALDMIDSLLFTAPFLYIYIQTFLS